jgi:hypothetical protein
VNEIYSDDEMSLLQSGDDLYVSFGRETRKLTSEEADRLAGALSSWALERLAEDDAIDGVAEIPRVNVSKKPYSYTIPEDGTYVVDGCSTALHAGALLESDNPFVVERSWV